MLEDKILTPTTNKPTFSGRFEKRLNEMVKLESVYEKRGSEMPEIDNMFHRFTKSEIKMQTT